MQHSLKIIHLVFELLRIHSIWISKIKTIFLSVWELFKWRSTFSYLECLKIFTPFYIPNISPINLPYSLSISLWNFPLTFHKTEPILCSVPLFLCSPGLHNFSFSASLYFFFPLLFLQCTIDPVIWNTISIA